MLRLNKLPEYKTPLLPDDAAIVSLDAAREVERYLQYREGHQETPLVGLPELAAELGVESIHIKDEGHRLGLGSFKALGGAYAVIRLVLQAAENESGTSIDLSEWQSDRVRSVASRMTVSCATDGNHGRSVAQGAQLIGARCVIFVHAGVSTQRIEAIEKFGAEIIRVDGNYDDSVNESARVGQERGWITVSDTSWPGYESTPGLVMQGYTALVSEALRQFPAPPTHVFVQAGVGGIAAAVAGHLDILLGDQRPFFTVVEPSKAACLFESLGAGRAIKIKDGDATVMAMLECYEPSRVAWRILTRSADAFMTVEDAEAIDVMRRLAAPASADQPIVSGESGGVGLAGLVNVAGNADRRGMLGLNKASRIFVINTEGATDPTLYQQIVGRSPAEVTARASN